MAGVQFAIVNIGHLSMNKFWGETERVRSATATCTLLTVGDRLLLVDPSPYPDDLERLLFENTGKRPSAIDRVYITHLHGDHRYGLELFPQATWTMARAALDEWRAASPEDSGLTDRFVAAEDALPPGVAVYSAPGHTHALHALRATCEWGTLIVAGDAVMTPEFFAAEEGFHNSVDFPLATETIRWIKRDADIVVPGHGNYFFNRR